MNDSVRVDRAGAGTFDRVLESIRQVKAARVPLGVCVVVSRANFNRPDDLYDFLASEGLPFNLVPLNYSGSARHDYSQLGVTRNDFADAWIRLYDRWFDGEGDDYVFCSDFVFRTRAIIQGAPSDCIGQQNCSMSHISTGPYGDIYPCATLSADGQWCYGNVMDTPMTRLLQGEVARRARSRFVDPSCLGCRWLSICNGGCMARSVRFFGDHNRRDYYCSSFRRMHEHIAGRLGQEPGLDFTRFPQPVLSGLRRPENCPKTESTCKEGTD
jgi:uncharacterized protein